MVAIIDNQKFRINFSHGHFKEGSSTLCTIAVQNGETWDAVGNGTATCHKSDNFCKEIGRKIALERALWNSPFFALDWLTDSDHMALVKRARRRAMWSSYFARSPKSANRVKQ